MNQSVYDSDDQFNLLKNLINDFRNVDAALISQDIPQKTIVLLGQTKAGKTTLLYYLLNKKLNRKLNDQLDIYQMYPEANFFNAQIGIGFNSTTVYPNIPNEIGQDKVLLIDMPGFNDSRQYYRLLNIFIIRQTIRRIKSIHICLVLPAQSLEGVNLLQTLTKNSFLLKDQLLQSPNCISFILTKVEDEISDRQIFSDNLQALKEEQTNPKFLKALKSFESAHIYVFENAQPDQKKGAQLKNKIINENNFYQINQNPSKLLSSKYADVMMGNGNWNEFIDFINTVLSQLKQKLIKMVQIFKQIIKIQYKHIYQQIGISQENSQNVFDQMRQINLFQIQSNKFIISNKEISNKEAALINFINKFVSHDVSDNHRFNNYLQNIIAWSSNLVHEQSNISNEIRLSISHIFKYFHLIFSTIQNINSPEIAKAYQNIVSSQEIYQAFDNYLSLIKENNCLEVIAQLEIAKNVIKTDQQFKKKLHNINPLLNLDQNYDKDEIIKQTIKIERMSSIKNVQVKKLLENPSKLSISKQKHKVKSQILNINSDFSVLEKFLKKMTPNKTNIKNLFDAISQIKTKLADKHMKSIARCIFEKLALFLAQNLMVQEAILFLLAIPAHNNAQNCIKEGIYFNELSEDFVNQVLIPYYSQINPNFSMIQQLYNYINILQISSEKIVENEIKYIQVLKEMHEKINNKNYKFKIKRFHYNLINHLIEQQGKQQLLNKLSINQKILEESKLSVVEEQIKKKSKISFI